SALAALAEPLRLGGVVLAVRNQIGEEVTAIEGAVLADPPSKSLEMVIFVRQPGEAPETIRLTQPDGDATSLVQKGSRLALEQISPYRVALSGFAQALNREAGAAPGTARETARRALARPFVPTRATGRVMLRNLLGVMALIDGDFAAAEAEFAASDDVP